MQTLSEDPFCDLKPSTGERVRHKRDETEETIDPVS